MCVYIYIYIYLYFAKSNVLKANGLSKKKKRQMGTSVNVNS
jgi:hypothetical protein